MVWNEKTLDKDWIIDQYVVCEKSIKQIATSINTTPATILNRLVEYGIPRRQSGGKPKHIVDYDLLKHKYVNLGNSIDDISTETGIHRSTLIGYLHKAGVKIRDRAKPIDEDHVVEMYVNKNISIEKIYRDFEVAQSRISDILKKHGVKIINGGSGNIVYKDYGIDENELVKMYQNNVCISALSKHFNAPNQHIHRLLVKNGIDIISDTGFYTRIVLDEQKLGTIIKEHQSGIPIKKLSVKYNIGVNILRRNLQSAKIKTNNHRDDIDRDAIINQYVNGDDVVDILKKNNIDQSLMYTILRKAKISTDRSKNIHQLYPFVTKEMLENFYFGKKMRQSEIAKQIGIPTVIVSRFMIFFEIPTRIGIQYGKSDSKPQREIFDYIKTLYAGEILYGHIIECSKRKYEADIFIPYLNIAIEYNGVYWHSVNRSAVKKDYHLKKRNAFNDLGIRLIQIWEDWWANDKEIIKSILNSLFGINFKLYARKTTLTKLDNSTAKIFLLNTHIQGSGNPQISYGLYEKDKLMQVMTFRKISDGCYEIDRLASSLYTTVVGGAKRLLTHFIADFNPSRIITYSLNDLFDGAVYEKLGFVYMNDTVPSYFYINKGFPQTRYNRQKFQKHKLVAAGHDVNKSESEIMMGLGYMKIYNSGNKKFEYMRQLK